MKLITIRDIYKNTEEYAGKTIKVGGWIRTSRASKSLGFIELNDGSCFKNLQIVSEDGKTETLIRFPAPDSISPSQNKHIRRNIPCAQSPGVRYP